MLPVAELPASLRFDGRDQLRIDECAKAVGVTTRHILDLATEGAFAGVNPEQFLKLKPAQRMIPAPAWRDFLASRYNVLHPKNRGTK